MIVVITMNELLENNSLIICPNSYKKALLQNLDEEKKLINIKFMTMEEYLGKYKFTYDEKAIKYLVDKGMKVANAITFLNNLRYVDNYEYANEKLNYLGNLKRELDEEGYLYYDHVFHKILERFKIKIYGYGKISSWYQNLFSSYELFDYPKKKEKFEVYFINNIEDEVEFVFQRIVDLLRNGVDINKIFLMNVDKEYYPILKRFASFYHLDIDIPNSDVLMGTMVGKKFLEMLEEKQSIEEITSFLEKNCDTNTFKVIINILNKYVDYNLLEVLELIKYDLLNTKVPKIKYENILRIKKVFDYVSDDEYIFLMGFNNPSIPVLRQDIDYITDNIKEIVGLDTTDSSNAFIKENTINYLKSINNLVISYKKVSPFNTYYPSILLDMMDYEEKVYERSMLYSIDSNKNLYTSYLDDYVKYGLKNKDLGKLYYNYQENDYLAYDNAYHQIDVDNLKEFIKNELTLSYSSVDNYFKCGFKYYLSNILNVNLYEETFMTIIGSFFHDVLRHMNEPDFNLENFYHDYLNEHQFTNKELFFFIKLKKDLEFVIEVIKKHQFISGFNQMLYEEKIDIPIKKSPYVHFKGFVDKIMYREKNNETLVSIIDYKTGNTDIKINNLKFGLSMQLPIYLYLVRNSNLFQNIKFTGFYLQYILNLNVKKGKKTILEQKEENLRLHGYSTSNIERLMVFDSTMENSEMIHGVKLNKSGELPKSSHALTDEEIDEIIKLTESKIMEAMDDILNGKFDINPKILNGKNVSCEFCAYKDICYVDEKNKVYLVSEEEEVE